MKQLSILLWIWIFANILIGSSFLFTSYFWIIFPVALSILLIISILSLKRDLKFSFTIPEFCYGILTGTLLYGAFLVIYLVLKKLPLPLLAFVQNLYEIVGPKEWWHYFVLIIIIIPGEEIFWRRYLQPQVIQIFGRTQGVITAACLYAFAHIWTGNPMLVAAAAFAGLVWGGLYEWKKSATLIIVSHLIFDLWLLVLFPLKF
jgi:membrane protease YdiL (CAAX protease family)